MTALQKVIKYCAIDFAIFLIVSIISGICGTVSAIPFLLGGNAAGEIQTHSVSGEIENLKIEVSAAALEIVSGSSFSVESNHKYLTVKEDNGSLNISEEKIFGGVSSDGVTVLLTVPEEFVFEDAQISTGAGKVSIDTLCANTLELDLGAGSADIGCLNVSSAARISGGTGKLAIQSGQIHDLSMDLGVGKLELTGKLTGNCTMDYGIGDAELNLLGKKEDYKIEIDKGVGSATLDGMAMADDSVYGGGENRIDIDGGVGSVRINFKEASDKK